MVNNVKANVCDNCNVIDHDINLDDLRARLAELEEIVEMAACMVSRDEIESVQSRAYEAMKK